METAQLKHILVFCSWVNYTWMEKATDIITKLIKWKICCLYTWCKTAINYRAIKNCLSWGFHDDWIQYNNLGLTCLPCWDGCVEGRYVGGTSMPAYCWELYTPISNVLRIWLFKDMKKGILSKTEDIISQSETKRDPLTIIKFKSCFLVMMQLTGFFAAMILSFWTKS